MAYHSTLAWVKVGHHRLTECVHGSLTFNSNWLCILMNWNVLYFYHAFTLSSGKYPAVLWKWVACDSCDWTKWNLFFIWEDGRKEKRNRVKRWHLILKPTPPPHWSAALPLFTSFLNSLSFGTSASQSMLDAADTLWRDGSLVNQYYGEYCLISSSRSLTL